MSAAKSAREKYLEYLDSPHWAQLRFLALRAAENRCECCTSEKELTGHHINYRNLTDCTVDDIMCLCWKCHQAAHKVFATERKSSRDYTRKEVISLINGFFSHGPVKPWQRPKIVGPSPKQVVTQLFENCQSQNFSHISIRHMVSMIKNKLKIS